MFTSRLSLVLILFLLIESTVIFAPGQAQAICRNPCMCQWGCYSGCTCPGQNGCPYCATPSSEKFQVNAAPSETTLDDTVALKPLPSLNNSYSIDRLIRRVGAGLGAPQCAQDNFRLKIMEEENSIKLDEGFFKEYAMQDNAVMFRIATRGKE